MTQKIDQAVALNFNPDDGTAPAIVASGTGALAKRIIDLAFLYNVKVREDPDLIAMLSALKIGDTIPAVAFAAIAEILTHVYQWEATRRQTLEADWSKEPQNER